MSFLRGISLWAWGLLGLLILAFVILVFMAPLERTLGTAIRYVYVHVSFTWAGMAGFFLAGLLGLVVAIFAAARLQRWTQIITWVALLMFLGGGFFSILAQQNSWGGILWQEPRNRTSLMVIAVALIVLVLNTWLPWIRARGLLYTALAIFVGWIIPNTPLVFHPQNAASSSESTAIRGAFGLLTVILLLISAWLAWQIGKRGKQSAA